MGRAPFPREAVAALRARVGAPLHAVVRALEQARGNLDVAARALTEEGCARIRRAAQCSDAQALAMFDRFGWDDSAAAEYVGRARRLRADKEAARGEAAVVLTQGAVEHYVMFGQRDDSSSPAEEVVYYVAGFFERLWGADRHLAFDCDDLNRGLCAALREIGAERVLGLVRDALQLPWNHRAAAFADEVGADEENEVVACLRAFVEAHRGSFRVLGS